MLYIIQSYNKKGDQLLGSNYTHFCEYKRKGWAIKKLIKVAIEAVTKQPSVFYVELHSYTNIFKQSTYKFILYEKVYNREELYD